MADSVRVRVAVGVDDRGNYYACGYTPGWGESKEGHDRVLMKGAQNGLVGGLVRFVWMEADVTLPIFESVEATVTDVGVVETDVGIVENE